MADLPYLQPDRLFFSSFDDRSLKEISVKCITNPISLDRIGTPLPGQFYTNTKSSVQLLSWVFSYQQVVKNTGHVIYRITKLIIPVFQEVCMTLHLDPMNVMRFVLPASSSVLIAQDTSDTSNCHYLSSIPFISGDDIKWW